MVDFFFRRTPFLWRIGQYKELRTDSPEAASPQIPSPWRPPLSEPSKALPIIRAAFASTAGFVLSGGLGSSDIGDLGHADSSLAWRDCIRVFSSVF